MHPNDGAVLTALYFDGRSAQGRTVTLLARNGELHITGTDVSRTLPLHDLQWPERTRHGKRLAHLKEGGTIQCSDTPAWDAWCAQVGLQESLVVRMQQSWRSVAASIVALAVLAVAINIWGLPWVARGIVTLTPHSVDIAVGERTLAAIDQAIMQPSSLPLARQAQLRDALASKLAVLPRHSVPTYTLLFRKSRIGPNALALPGGTLIMTDEMVELLGGDENVLAAVVSHELGHVHHRHGLRMLVQTTVLGALGSLVLGDASTLLAAVPALLGQAQYSRQAEHEADVYAARTLKAAGIAPSIMVTLFDKLAQQRKAKTGSDARPSPDESWLGIAFASHPSDAERIAFFRDAASAR